MGAERITDPLWKVGTRHMELADQGQDLGATSHGFQLPGDDLRHLVGEARAKALMLTGCPISAEQAANWGLIWQVFDDQDLAMEAKKLTRYFVTAPTASIAMTKKAIHAALTNNLDQQLDLERDLQREAGRSGDYAEGVAAFLEKRAPQFKGN